MRTNSKHPKLSVAIPIYNEEEVLPHLIERLGKVLRNIQGGPHEVIFVNDGSEDRSAEILDQASIENSTIVAIHFSRNFGHQAALTAAIEYVTGDAVILMDGDLQDQPEEIPRFLEQYENGHDVVYAIRTERKESLFLRASYFVAYRIIGLLSEIQLPLDSGDFSLLSSRVVTEMRKAPEHNRYLRGLRAWVGFSQVGIKVQRPSRLAGRSKYSTMGLLKLALNGIFSFSVVPLRVATILGFLGILFGFIYALYAIFGRFFLESTPRGFTTTILMMILLASIQLFFLGVLGEYLGRIYEEVKRRPQYIVERVTKEK